METKPQIANHLEAISKAKGSSQLFSVTGGEHLNSNDYFKIRTLDERRQAMNVIYVDKILHLEYLNCMTLKNELVAENALF